MRSAGAGWREWLAGGLIVSCQAREGHPLHDPVVIAAMARAATMGGAAGLRLNGEEDIREVRRTVNVPIIGIRKVWTPEFPVYITPTFADAQVVADAGADIIALDATSRPRRGGERLDEMIPKIKDVLGLPVMADVATLEEGMRAAALGADLVATTLAGYTDAGPTPVEPDLDLVRDLSGMLRVPVVAEGRYRTPPQVRDALRAGAFAVVVGRAITDPLMLTRAFVEGTKGVR